LGKWTTLSIRIETLTRLNELKEAFTIESLDVLIRKLILCAEGGKTLEEVSVPKREKDYWEEESEEPKIPDDLDTKTLPPSIKKKIMNRTSSYIVKDLVNERKEDKEE